MSIELDFLKSKGLEFKAGKLINSSTGKVASETLKNKFIMEFCDEFDKTPKEANSWINDTAKIVKNRELAKDVEEIKFYNLDTYSYNEMWNDVDDKLWKKYFSAYINRAYSSPMLFCHDPERKHITFIADWDVGTNDKGNGIITASLNAFSGLNLEKIITNEIKSIESDINNELSVHADKYDNDDAIIELVYKKYPASILSKTAIIQCARTSKGPVVRFVSPKSPLMNKSVFIPSHITNIAPNIIANCSIKTQPIFWSTDPSVLALNFTNIDEEIENGSKDISEWIGVEKKIAAGTGQDAVIVWRHAIVSILHYTNNARQAIFLTGKGQIGKTAVQKAITTALGSAACSEDAGTLLKDFNINTFGKRLISIADCKDFVNVTKSGKFQRITGNDVMRFEKKGCDAFSWQAGSQKLLFTMNSIPAVNIHDQAERTRVAVFNMELPEDCDERVKPDVNGNAKGDHGYSDRLASSVWSYYKFCLKSDIDNGIDPNSDIIPSKDMIDLFEELGTDSQIVIHEFLDKYIIYDESYKGGMLKRDFKEGYDIYLSSLKVKPSKYVDSTDAWRELFNLSQDERTKFYGLKLHTNMISDEGKATKGAKGLMWNPDTYEELCNLNKTHKQTIQKPSEGKYSDDDNLLAGELNI